MEPDLTYLQLQKEINQLTSTLLEEYRVNKSIRLELPSREEDITQEIFLNAFDNHVNSIINIVKEDEDFSIEEETSIQLKQKKVEIEKLYETFTQRNKKLYQLLLKQDKKKQGEVKHKSKEDSNEYATPSKPKQELHRKNCKLGLKSFESEKRSSLNKSYHSDHSDYDYRDRDKCVLRSNKRYINQLEQSQPLYQNHQVNSQSDNYYSSHSPNDSGSSYFKTVVLVLLVSVLLNLFFISKHYL